MKTNDYTKSRTVKDLLKCLAADGHTIEHGKHYKIKHKDGKGLVIISATPSDQRAILNMIADLRRNGF